MPGSTSSELDVDDPAAPPPAEDTSLHRPRRRRWLAGLVIVCVVGAGAGSYVMTGGHLFATIPPEGVIWFGTSFDPNSDGVRDRVTSAEPDEELVMVGRLPRSIAGSRLVIRGYLDGTLVTIAWTDSFDEGVIWGFSLGSIEIPGNWRYEIAEAGGQALASGQFVVAE